MAEMDKSTNDLNELEILRLEKVKQLRADGIEVYPNRFDRQHTLAEIIAQFFFDSSKNKVAKDDIKQGVVKTAGRIMGKREMGKAAFLEIRDEYDSMQIYANNKTLSEIDYKVFKQLDIGDIIGIEGEPFLTKTEQQSIRATDLKILSKNLHPLPVVKEKEGKQFDAFSDVETRYRKRYLDLVVNSDVRKIFQMRSRIVQGIRTFLTEKGFIEVETPMMHSIASGAAARPFETHHNTLDMSLFMRIAPELHLKRLIVGGFEKVFELNRNFRNEGISTKHNPEFTMMELYQAYADYNDMMQITEEMFVYLADNILGKRVIPYGDQEISLETPWQKKGYLEIIEEKTGLNYSQFLELDEPPFKKAKEMAESIGIKCDNLHTFWEVVDEVFSEKVEPELIQPIFITEFPLAISPLAKSQPGNKHLVERFEPYIVGREMGNAFSELNDPMEQRKRFSGQLDQKEQGAKETMNLDEDFIDALRVGMPPTGGLGIGIDRLIMLFTNVPTIKDVILFPLLRKKKES